MRLGIQNYVATEAKIAQKQTGKDQNRKHKSVAETKKGPKTGPLNYHSHGYCTNLKDKNEKDKLKGRTREQPILGPRGQTSANYFFFSYFFLFGFLKNQSKFDVLGVIHNILKMSCLGISWKFF